MVLTVVDGDAVVPGCFAEKAKLPEVRTLVQKNPKTETDGQHTWMTPCLQEFCGFWIF